MPELPEIRRYAQEINDRLINLVFTELTVNDNGYAAVKDVFFLSFGNRYG